MRRHGSTTSPEKVKAWSRTTYQRHKVKIAAKNRLRYHARSPEKVIDQRERDARYRAAHREDFRHWQARWRRDNPDKVKARNDRQTKLTSAAVAYLRQCGLLANGATASALAGVDAVRWSTKRGIMNEPQSTPTKPDNLPNVDLTSITFDKLQNRKPPNILYHYTDQTGLLGILQSGQLHATKVQYMNDSTEFGRTVDLVS